MRPRHYDWLVVGAGFTGAVFAERMATRGGRRVLVIDGRKHVGGNAHDVRHETGVTLHVHGPHLFHTNSRAVFDYLSRFTEWMPYEHRVLALVEGRLVPLPFNFAAIDACFSRRDADRIRRRLLDAYGPDVSVPVLSLRTRAEPELKALADYVYEAVFRRYTLKQWGLAPETLSPSVTGRVPIRTGYDDRFFQDRYQGQPREGYTQLFNRILGHDGIDLRLGCRFEDLGGDVTYDRMLYTGPIDAFFGHVHGQLPYRSLAFEFRRLESPLAQPVAQVNFPGDEPFTRVTDFGHLTEGVREATAIAVEYPMPYRPGENEPYYPVPCDAAEKTRSRYAELALAAAPRVLFAGRLGDYRYINMDQAVAAALSLFRRHGRDGSRDRR